MKKKLLTVFPNKKDKIIPDILIASQMTTEKVLM